MMYIIKEHILTAINLRNFKRTEIMSNIMEQNFELLFEKSKIETDLAKGKAFQIINQCIKRNIQILTILDEEFPQKLKNIRNGPIVLYAIGNTKLLHLANSIAIVGTRTPCEYSINLTKEITKICIEKSYVIVSGLALGIDTVTHTACVNNLGKTISVLPSNLVEIYPRENIKLANNLISSGGCMLSEYSPIETIKSINFRERDRLQSGLSKSVIVIETEIDGGTMFTAEFAIDQKRNLAIVNPPEEYKNNTCFDGNRKLLRLYMNTAIPVQNFFTVNHILSL